MKQIYFRDFRGAENRKEGRRVRKDGSKFWGSVLITAIHDDYGRVIGFTKVTRDLSNAPRHDVAIAKLGVD